MRASTTAKMVLTAAFGLGLLTMPGDASAQQSKNRAAPTTTFRKIKPAPKSGKEMQMIALQSTLSQRATSLQMTAPMMKSMNESQKTVAKNMGR